MNDNEINIAIAEAVKWKPSVDSGICWDDNGKPIVSPPSYTTDLNAMHEAENMLNAGQINTYLGFLYLNAKTASANPAPWEIIAARVGVHATARQRAEAFLRTLGKWKD